jgi:hypothetical protein
VNISINIAIIMAIVLVGTGLILKNDILQISKAQIAGLPGTETDAQSPPQLSQPQSKSICDHNDKFVNATESKICHVPVTIGNTTTTKSSSLPTS